MARAASNLSQTTAIIVLARLAARKAVKRQLQAQGKKPQHIAARELTILAEQHLAMHRELIAEAKATVAKWTAEGFFGKRPAKA
jgi:hypothetical protein